MNNNVPENELLLKFSFLYTGKSDLAKMITERFIKENPTFTSFSKIEIVQKLISLCREAFKNTSQLKQVFANVVTFHQIKKSSFVSKLLSYSSVRKEIALLHFVAAIPIKIVGEMLNIKEDKVRASILRMELEFIPYFPNDDLLVKEHINQFVKKLDLAEQENVLAVDYVRQMAVIKWFSIPSLILVIILLVGAYNYISDVQRGKQIQLGTSTILSEDTDSLTKGNTKSSNDTTNRLNTQNHQDQSPLTMHIPNEMLFQISEYQTFYNSPYFYSSKQTKYFVVMQMIEMYYVKKFMYEHNLLLSDEQVEFLMSLSNSNFDSMMHHETESTVIDNILKNLNISKEDYIQNYLFPLQENAELIKVMIDKGMSLLDAYGNLYAYDAIPTVFFETVGLTKEEFEEIGNLLMSADWDTVENNPKGLPFNIVGTTLKISSKDGILYIDNPERFSLDSTVYAEIYNKYILNNLDQFVSRNTWKTVINYLEDIEIVNEDENVLAVELLELLRTLERSIEWELQH